MEKCEIDLNGGSTKTEPDPDSVKKLDRHLGRVLTILQLFGIPVKGDGTGNKILDLLVAVCFPVFLHASCLYLLFGSLGSGHISYGSVIDTILPILPCIMWTTMRCNAVHMRSFFADLGRVASRNFKSQNRCLSYSTNAAICFVFLYPLVLVTMRFAQGNDVTTHEVFRILQESLVPVTTVVVYTSVCVLLLQKLRYLKNKLQKSDISSPSSTDLMRDCLSVARSVETFETLMCNLMFAILFHGFLVVSILIIDTFYVEDFVERIMFEGLCEMGYVFFSLVIMSSCAGGVTSEMAEIKSVVLGKAFIQCDQGNSMNNEKQVDLLLKKDPCVLTVGKAIVFDRGFILKVLLAIFAEVVVIAEIVPRLNM